MKPLKMSALSSFFIVIVLFQFLCIALSSTFAAETDKAGRCTRCGMDMAFFALNRLIITYDDGMTAEVCSLHCAVSELKKNRDRKVRSLRVVDYATGELTDAKTATWVIGGRRQGVMTSLPKWAFAREEDASGFVRENGGEVTTFAKAMKAAEEEMPGTAASAHRHSHAGHAVPGAQMLYNPGFGDDIYHTHPAGMWMVNYKFMHTDMRGLRDGSMNVDQGSVGFMRNTPYNYMMIPTSMTMDMHMFMVMYGATDRLTVMAMTNYQNNEMKMLMDMGPGKMITTEPPMRTDGFGDIEVRGIFKISKYLTGSLGISIPTGSIEEEFETMRKTFRAPYDMQPGTGTFDLKPALTYNAFGDGGWNWGAQAMYTIRLGNNKNDWRFGDNFKLTTWLQRAMGPFTPWARLAYNDTGRVKGEDQEIRKLNHPLTGMGAPIPDADPDNYGGQRLDGLVGLSYSKGAFAFGVEGGIPLYQDLNGLQLKTKWVLNAGIQVMF